MILAKRWGLDNGHECTDTSMVTFHGSARLGSNKAEVLGALLLVAFKSLHSFKAVHA